MSNNLAVSSLILAFIMTAGANAQCGFNMSTTSTVTAGVAAPRAVVTGDFNGDGILDVVTASTANNTVTFSPGLGNGNFGPAVTSSIPGSAPAAAIVVADLNGDGRLDLALACTNSSTIPILIGNGAGSFSLLTTLTSNGSAPVAIALGDVDNDTKQDLVWVNNASNTYTVCRNLGAGSFSVLPPQSAGGTSPQGLVLADFTGDGRLDLAICCQGTSSVATFSGNGFGQFAQYASIPPGAGPTAIATGDFNGDGRPDLAVANFSSGTLAWAFSTGASFTGFTPTAAVANFRGICVADLNNDGRLDLIGTSSSPNLTNVYLGQAGGTFSPANTLPAAAGGPWNMAPGDFNSDGRLDLAVAFNASGATLAYLNSTVTLPVINTNPANTTVVAGTPASFTVSANGGNLAYQWRRNYVNLNNGGPISGANSPTLTINPTALGDNLGLYDVVVFNTCGTTTSRMGVLGVEKCPGDFNGDGAVDFFDYLDYVDAFSIGCG